MIFKVILCYNNGSTEILNQFNDELMAIKFTYDMIEDNLSKVICKLNTLLCHYEKQLK